MQALLAAPLFAAPAAATTTAAAAGAAIPAMSAMVAGPGAAAAGTGLIASQAAPVAAAAGGGFLQSLTVGSLLKGGLGLFGAASSILGSNANASLLEEQAQMNEIMARSEEIRGLEEGNAIMDAENEAQAANIARFAASGVGLSAGAPQQVARGIERTGQRGLLFARTNADIAAANRAFRGNQLRSRAVNVRRGGIADAVGGLAAVALS